MLYLVHMVVDLPDSLPVEEASEILAREKAYSQHLQRTGAWVSLWRVAGQYANYSVFDVQSNDRLHDLLSGLPLYRYMTIAVTPLARHPSWLEDRASTEKAPVATAAPGPTPISGKS